MTLIMATDAVDEIKKIMLRVYCYCEVHKDLMLRILLVFGLFLIAGDVFASEGGGGLPYESHMESLRGSISGPVAGALSLLGIVGAGGMLIFGGDIGGFMKTVIFVVLVASLIMGAGSMVDMVTAEG